jgi:hypothetical protein
VIIEASTKLVDVYEVSNEEKKEAIDYRVRVILGSVECGKELNCIKSRF